jgi:hypothetical protein
MTRGCELRQLCRGTFRWLQEAYTNTLPELVAFTADAVSGGMVYIRNVCGNGAMRVAKRGTS